MLLRQWRNGDHEAHERLLALVYDELRRIARARLRSRRANHTLQPTALVHEAYLRLSEPTQPLRIASTCLLWPHGSCGRSRSTTPAGDTRTSAAVVRRPSRWPIPPRIRSRL